MKIDLLNDGIYKFLKEDDSNLAWTIGHKLRFEIFANYIIKNNFKTILEVGFGNNYFVDILQKLNYEGQYLGIDLNDDYVNAQESTTQYMYRKIDLYDVHDKFDVIVLGELIEHLPKSDVTKFLSKCAEIADNIIISTPNKIDGKINWPDDHEDEFSLEELKSYTQKFYNTRRVVGVWKPSKITREELKGSEDEKYEYLPKGYVDFIQCYNDPENSRQIILFGNKK